MNESVSPPPVEVTPENVEKILSDAGCKDPDFGLIQKAGHFDDGFVSDKINPLASGLSEFPFDEIFKRLDGAGGDGESVQSASERDFSDTADFIRRIHIWIACAKAEDQRAIKSIGIRFIAAAWVINPKIFGDVAAHVVADKFGVSPQIFKTKTADFSRTFKVQNRFQVHDWQNRRRVTL